MIQEAREYRKAFEMHDSHRPCVFPILFKLERREAVQVARRVVPRPVHEELSDRYFAEGPDFEPLAPGTPGAPAESVDFLPLWAFMCVFPGLTLVPDAGPDVPEDDPDEVAPDSAAYAAPEKTNKTEMARTVAVFCVAHIADFLLWSSSRSNATSRPSFRTNTYVFGAAGGFTIAGIEGEILIATDERAKIVTLSCMISNSCLLRRLDSHQWGVSLEMLVRWIARSKKSSILSRYLWMRAPC